MGPAEQCGFPLQVLIVEDCADTADTVGAILAFDGHDVQIAYNGAAAIDAVSSRWPDVVLLDLAMPGFDGYQVADKIRQKCGDRAQPVFIVISGHAKESDRLRSEAEGIHLHFAKPMDADLLLGVVRQFAARRYGTEMPAGP
jgi:CheY-like chemotaxis protein